MSRDLEERCPTRARVQKQPVAERRALSQLAAGFVAGVQQKARVSGLSYSFRLSSRELAADLPLALARSFGPVCWIQSWLIAAREQLREWRLSRALLVWPPVGFRLASVSQAHFRLAAEWWTLVSSQPPANFVVQAQPVERASGRLYWLRERRLSRALLLQPEPLPPGLLLESPPGPSGLIANPFPPAFDPMPHGRRLEPGCRPRGRE